MPQSEVVFVFDFDSGEKPRSEVDEFFWLRHFFFLQLPVFRRFVNFAAPKLLNFKKSRYLCICIEKKW